MEEVYYRKLFDEGPVGIVVGDQNGQIIATNPALSKIVGHPKDTLRSLKDIERITYPDDVDADRRLFQELLSGKRQTYQIEKRYVKSDGSISWGRLTISMIDNGAKAHFIFGMVEDINSHKQLEEQLRASLEKEEAVNQKLIGNEVEIIRLKKELEQLKER